MEKEQLVAEVFTKVDTDQDGQINFQQFGNLLKELKLPSIYSGSIKKTIRKINYNNPDKETLNLEQTKEYINSLETASKHDIWKKKLEILDLAADIQNTMKKDKKDNIFSQYQNPFIDLEGKDQHKPTSKSHCDKHGSGKEESAAPGATVETVELAAVPSKVPDNTLQEANIKVLVGPSKPNYSCLIDIEVDKVDNGPKVKPFIKLVFRYTNQADAQQMKEVFTSNFQQFLVLLSEDISEWTEEMDNFKINSMVQGSNVTFFITTVNEQMMSLIQMFSEILQMSFQIQFKGRAHLRYQFQYDFQRYVKDQNSSFYDCFVNESKLTLNAAAKNIIRSFRQLYKNTAQISTYSELFQIVIPVLLLHLDCIEADLQFDSFTKEKQYELQSKEEINAMLRETAEVIIKMEVGGMTPRNLLRLLNCDIEVNASVGEWKAKTFLKLPNFTKILENSLKKYQQEEQPQGYEPINEETSLYMVQPPSEQSQDVFYKPIEPKDQYCDSDSDL